MYAIVDIAGQQMKVEEGKEIFVNKLSLKDGESIEFKNVMLVDNDGKVKVGAPTIKGASVTATLVEQVKADKIIVFKMKRRKGYKVKNGHRQYLTKLSIDSIS